MAGAQEAAPGATEDFEAASREQFAEPATAGASAAPLLSYRREDDAGVNPLRATAGATTANVVMESPAAQPAAGSPRYAVRAAASEDLRQYDANVVAPGAAPIVPVTPLPIAGAPSAAPAEPPSAVAPLEDYVAAPLASYSAAASQTEATRPTAIPATTTPAVTTPAAMPPATDDAGNRRLAPPSSESENNSAGSASGRKPSLLPPAFSQFKSLSSAGAGLAIVVGLFLLCMWLLRRNGPKPTGVLPEGAFAVLGRAPLTAQSFAQLLRIGNKLVLVAMTADGAQPLAEVTDPAEVDRIAGLCVSGRPGGSSAEFQQVLAQLSKEPARGFLGREGSAARRR